MNGIFLNDKGVSYTYEKLLSDINNKTTYCQTLKSDSIYNFFLNLVLALIANKSITLLDSDIKLNEILSLDKTEINRDESINKVFVHSFDELRLLILNSISSITLFTSGTTGQPKKIIHNIQTLTRTTRISDKYKNQIWAFAYNPSHMAGLQVFFQGFLNQNTFINVFNLKRQEIYALIEKYGITHISATPTFYRLLLPVENQYPSVIRTTFGGEKSDNNLFEAIQKIFPNAKINNIYASTEAGSLFIAKGEYFQIPSDIKDKVKIDDGELLLHKSLLGESESFIYENDFYRTGDLIEWIDNDVFKFKSRKNELINIGGYKVNPNEVEEVIYKIQGVEQVIVYSKPNSILGNILCADIQLNKDTNLKEQDIRKILSTQLQDFKIPRRIIFVQNIELTRTGKIKRI